MRAVCGHLLPSWHVRRRWVSRCVPTTTSHYEKQPFFIVSSKDFATSFFHNCFTIQKVSIQNWQHFFAVSNLSSPVNGLFTYICNVKPLPKVQVTTSKFANWMLYNPCTTMIDNDITHFIPSHSFKHSTIPSAMFSRLSLWRVS